MEKVLTKPWVRTQVQISDCYKGRIRAKLKGQEDDDMEIIKHI